MALVLPSDLYRSESVATVSGMSGNGRGVGTIISTFLIGYVSDHYSFEPILITASFIPFWDDIGPNVDSAGKRFPAEGRKVISSHELLDRRRSGRDQHQDRCAFQTTATCSSI
jgi:hypothetical protein